MWDTSPDSLRGKLARSLPAHPDPLDFAQLAERLVDGDAEDIAEMLRLVWNARGEADIVTLVPILRDPELLIAVPALQCLDRYKRGVRPAP